MSVLPVGFGSATNGGGYQIERSLRFNSADSAYLNKTFSTTPTNRAKKTVSFWVKRSALSSAQDLFSSYNGGGQDGLFFNSSDQLQIYAMNGGAGGTVNGVLRDVSAWYHIVYVIDTTQATAGDRLKIWINGVNYPSSSWTSYSAPTLNSTADILFFQSTEIGRNDFTSGGYLNGYLTETYYIDGQALTPSSFGQINASTGVWEPIAYTGTYGTNGFYLPFKTASNWSGFFDGTDDKLTSSTNAIAATGEFSVEAWVYQTARTVTSDQHIFSQYTSGATAGRWYLRFNGTTVALTTGLGTSVSCATTVNTGTWYHVCVTRDSGNRFRVFLNGVLDGTAVISGSLDTAASVIGATQTANYWQGYISNVRAVSGQIPTAYQTSSTTVGASIFTPSTSQLTAVSGTSLLTCQSSTFVDNSGLGRTITPAGDARPQQFSPFTLDVTDDHSGTGNNWQPNNLDLRTTGVGADITVDSPTSYGIDTGVGGEVRGNYCTLNPLDKTAAATLSNGNLQALLNGVNYFAKSTIAISSGKWYWEVTASATAEDMIGITKSEVVTTGYFGSQATSYGYYKTNGNKYNSATGTAYGASYASGDIIGVALDLDAGTLTYYKNGVSQGTAFTGLSGTFFAGVSTAGTGGTQTINFGQRPFEKWNGSAYVANTAPSGFKALCTQNFTTPTIGATSSTLANKYMDVTLYTGNGAVRSITNSGSMQPDFVWDKLRSGANSHRLFDAVRGVEKALYSNLTNIETTETGTLTSFNSNGFSLGTNTETNTNTSTYVAWQWKANGAGSTNSNGTAKSSSVTVDSGTDTVTWNSHGMSDGQKIGFFAATMPGGLSAGTLYYVRDAATNTFKVAASSGGAAIDITSNGTTVTAHTTLTSTVSANTASGFSIVTYTGTGANATVEHGLGKAPSFIIVKSRSIVDGWLVYSSILGATKYLVLSSSNAQGTLTAAWNDTAPTSTVFSLGTNAAVNQNSATYVAYCFAEVPGYSAFGSYTGNGSSTDGPFIYLGFRPAYVLIKRSSAIEAWCVMDSKREGYNVDNDPLFANLPNSEGTQDFLDLLSNGFKLRSTDTGVNGSGTYIYAAFAESPFKYSLAR